ncbi:MULTISPECIES: hypothetical protein [unclassified Sporolactobacillus]|uniref:hypothetical protein n=1 Tax=unclassified Sporolactobacillus TaxID=2628533 RepID=UPI0023681310|nr:hypothetical protein [Sporolactobacillus sp. CQH2019]MDD9149208.1 hypothetical protein [Sporolactobacillus sp. CQH2019]
MPVSGVSSPSSFAVYQQSQTQRSQQTAVQNQAVSTDQDHDNDSDKAGSRDIDNSGTTGKFIDVRA